MNMLLGIFVILLVLSFAAGARLMLTSLAPEPGLHTYCVKCGHELTDDVFARAAGAALSNATPSSIDAAAAGSRACPKCRRLLTPELTVTCSRSTIVGRRFAAGAAIVAAVLIVGPTVLLYCWPATAGSAGGSSVPASQE